jgi:CRISPR type III-B/RAMP module RAMP protein Cmr6
LFHHGQPGRSVALVARLEGRLAINLADSLIQNAGIALDRLFGLPYIPGSAVKGVCRAAALEELNAATGANRERLFDFFRSIFGTADNDYRPENDLAEFGDLLEERSENQRGAVAFLPAYPLNEAKVVVDLTNVHFPEYYRTGNLGDLSVERPQPNPFPCVEEGAQFAFCLVLSGPGHARELLAEAERWLVEALTVRGIGAKIAAGYGWFSIEPPSVLEDLFAEERRVQAAIESAAQQAVATKAAALLEASRKAALKPEDRIKEDLCRLPDQEFAAKVIAVGSLPNDEQKAVLLSLRDDAGKRDRWKKWKKSDKDTDKKRVAAVLEVSKIHGVTLP